MKSKLSQCNHKNKIFYYIHHTYNNHLNHILLYSSHKHTLSRIRINTCPKQNLIVSEKKQDYNFKKKIVQNHLNSIIKEGSKKWN